MGRFRRENSGNRFDRSDDRRGGRSRDRDRSRGRSEGRRDRRPSEMTEVTCDKCGKSCQVPFKPTGDKPVLCSDCFRKKDNSRSFDRSDRSSSGPGVSFEQINQINAKLDRILKVLNDLEIINDEDGSFEDDIEENDDEDIEDEDQDENEDDDDLEENDDDEEDDEENDDEDIEEDDDNPKRKYK